MASFPLRALPGCGIERDEPGGVLQRRLGERVGKESLSPCPLLRHPLAPVLIALREPGRPEGGQGADRRA
jgi:hypothetical protein